LRSEIKPNIFQCW